MSLRDQISRLTARLQHQWMGRPAMVVYFGFGLGDDLLCTTLAREWKKRGLGRLVILSKYPELYDNNPDVDAVFNFGYATVGRLRRWGYGYCIPHYSGYDAVTDRDDMPPGHFIRAMCGYLGNLQGEIELRPYLHLRPEEKEKGRLFPNQAVIQSAGLAGMRNKQWGAARYQQVADELAQEVRWVQLGTMTDPPITGAVDLRGKTTLRESAAILAGSKVHVGEVGFLMHLARAVETRAVIVYGGREDPAMTGYIANENIVGRTDCSPCWQRTKCDFGHACMGMIAPAEVAAAVRRQIARAGTPLEVQRGELAGAHPLNHRSAC